MRGRFFEEFQPGEVVETAGRTVTDEDVMAFARVSGDDTGLHTDEEFARRGPFGRRIAHGALVFSLAIGLTTRTKLVEGTIVAFNRVDNLRFTRPVFIGDTIRVTKRLLSADAKTPEAGVLAFDTRVLNQHAEIVLAFVDRLLVKRLVARPPVAAASGCTLAET